MNTKQILLMLRQPVLRWISLVTLALLLTNTVVFILLLQPRAEHRYQLDQELAELRNELSTLTTLGRRASELDGLSENVRLLKQKLAQPASVISVNRLIQQVSGRHSIKILRQANQQEQDEGRVVIRQSLVVEGRYKELRKFIDDLYHLPTLSVIEKAEIQKHRRSKDLLSTNILLTTYAQGVVSE